MATSFTSIFGFPIMTPGDPSVRNAWGTVIDNFIQVVEETIAGNSPINIAGLSTYTLTTANNAPSENDQACWQFTGALTGPCVVTIQQEARVGLVWNNTSGAQNVTLTTGAAGTPATLLVPPTALMLYSCDGTNVVAPSLGNPIFCLGNAQIGGNLGVGGTLAVTGASYFSTGSFTGACTFGNDANFSLSTASGFPAINFQAGTYIQAGTSGNNLLVAVGGDLGIEANGGAGGTGIYFTTGPGLTLEQSGGAAASGLVVNLSNTGSSLAYFEYFSAQVGTITTNGTTTAYNTSSDRRLKAIHGLADGALLSKLKVYDASFLSDSTLRYPMLIADEVQAVLPSAVSGTVDAVEDIGTLSALGRSPAKTGVPKPAMLPAARTWAKTGTRIKPQMIDHSALVPALLAYVQALEARIARLEAGKA